MKKERGSDATTPGATSDLSRRRFLQSTVATAAGAVLPAASNATAAAAGKPPAPPAKGNQPNFLILMCDENRFPPVYESPQTQAFRLAFLQTQNLLRRNAFTPSGCERSLIASGVASTTSSGSMSSSSASRRASAIGAVPIPITAMTVSVVRAGTGGCGSCDRR